MPGSNAVARACRALRGANDHFANLPKWSAVNNPISHLQSAAETSAGALDRAASPHRRAALIRVVDPLDLVGKGARSILPTQTTPAMAHAVYYAVLAGFVVTGPVEPPVAALLAASHLMLASHNRFLQEAGTAIDDSA